MAAQGFPDDFVWGAATSAYQIEGSVRADGRGESIWDRFSHTPGRVTNGDTGDLACDHYRRWRDDVDLLRELQLRAYRFSIAWPRILATGTSAVNQAGLDFYDRLVDQLLQAGITPWPTLYHWDLPQPLQDAGGWPNRETVDRFLDVVDVVTRRLGDRVSHWMTINEPLIAGHFGHSLGIHAPGVRSWRAGLAASHHLLLAHGRAVEVVRTNSPGAQVGIVLNPMPALPADDSQSALEAAERWDGIANRWYLQAIAGRGYPDDIIELFGADAPEIDTDDMRVIAVPTDFLGINYYAPTYITPGDPPTGLSFAEPPPGTPVTSIGWPIQPDVFLDVLSRIHADFYPGAIVVAENGAAFEDPPVIDGRVDDAPRIDYLAGHLDAVSRAIGLGIPVEGYFAWSFMDNFEWSSGYGPRFGLVHVDYATQARTIKDSGRWYAGVVADNELKG